MSGDTGLKEKKRIKGEMNKSSYSIYAFAIHSLICVVPRVPQILGTIQTLRTVKQKPHEISD